MKEVKARKVNKVKIINCENITGIRSDNICESIEEMINNIMSIECIDKDITIDDVSIEILKGYEVIVIRYHYMDYMKEGTPVAPVRKYKIERIQTKIERMTEGIKELLETFSDKDDLKIEEFMIYEDFASRERDHGILIYSYNEFEPINGPVYNTINDVDNTKIERRIINGN